MGQKMYTVVDKATGRVTYTDQEALSDATKTVYNGIGVVESRRVPTLEEWKAQQDAKKKAEQDRAAQAREKAAAQQRCQNRLADARNERVAELQERYDLALKDRQAALDAVREQENLLGNMVRDSNVTRAVTDDAQDVLGATASAVGLIPGAGWGLTAVRIAAGAIGAANSFLRPEQGAFENIVTGTDGSVGTVAEVLEQTGKLSATGQVLSKVQGGAGLAADLFEFAKNPGAIPAGLPYASIQELQVARAIFDKYDPSLFEDFTPKQFQDSIDQLIAKRRQLEAAEAKLAEALDPLAKEKAEQDADRTGWSAASQQCTVEGR